MARHSSPITTHSQSKKLSRKTLTNQLEALQACLSALEITNQDLRGSNQELQEEATRAKEDLRDATKQDTHPGGDLIPCPHGSPGDHCRGYILITELGLEGNYRFYMGLRRLVKTIMQRAGFDFTASWANQSTCKINQVCTLAAQRQPSLRRFANDWATKAFMLIYLKS